MAILKVDTITSADTPSVSITDGLVISGVTTMTQTLNVDAGSSGMIDFGDLSGGYGRLYADSTGTFIGSKSNDPLVLRTNHAEVARFDEYGRMMIGQTAAVIASSSEFAEIVLSGKTRGAGITLKDVDANTQFQIRTDDAGGDPMTLMNASTNHPIAIRTNNTERVRFRADGRVSIASSLAVAGVTTAAAFIPSSGQLSHRNLIINGAMMVAQRGTSSTNDGFGTVDRFKCLYDGTDEAPTQAQHALTSSDTGPWAEGFRSCLQITNGNQTSGAGAADSIAVFYEFEAQDIANSGWDYTSSSGYITLSFWMKASVAQNYYGYLRSIDGTQRAYAFETGSLSADTWTKITKTIPGDSNLTFNDNTDLGFQIIIYGFAGTNLTGTRTLDTWINNDDANRTPDNTSTWYTTNDSDIELTGFQLEVGSAATPFEHRSFGDELRRCQRYYEKSYPYGTAPGTSGDTGRRGRRVCASATNQTVFTNEQYQVRKRATPTVTTYSNNGSSGNVMLMDYGSTTVHASSSVYGSCDYGFEVSGSGTANAIAVFWTADAEL